MQAVNNDGLIFTAQNDRSNCDDIINRNIKTELQIIMRLKKKRDFDALDATST